MLWSMTIFNDFCDGYFERKDQSFSQKYKPVACDLFDTLLVI